MDSPSGSSERIALLVRGRQITRILRLVQLLSRPSGLSAIEAAHELGCARRTFYRDLRVLTDLCYPLYTEEEGAEQRYRLRADFRSQHRLPLTHEELTALWLARDALASLQGTAFVAPARSLAEKVEASLSEEVRRRAQHAKESIAIAPPGKDYGPRAAIVDTLRRAAQARSSVEIVYRALGDGQRRRRVDPYLLWLDPRSESLYLAAWAHDRRELRTFLVDRILDAVTADERFELPADFDAERFLVDSFAAFRGAPATVRLAFRGRAAGLVAERTWHPTQRVSAGDGGSLELTMQVPLSPGLTGWVLSWVPEVRVLSPAALANEVARRLRAGLAEPGTAAKRGAARVTPDVARPVYGRRRR
jgi:proteasome accessory factor B